MTAKAEAVRLAVHLPCGRIRGTTVYGRQGCPCAPSEPWPNCDVSSTTDLCQVCARGTAGGVSRWSWLGCTSCRSVERALQEWLGIRVLPLGRHSIMNGVAHRLAAATTDEVDAFCHSFGALGLSWSKLFDWGQDETRRLTALGSFPLEDVPLNVWQRAFPPSVSASVDAYERFLRTKIPAHVVAR